MRQAGSLALVDAPTFEEPSTKQARTRPRGLRASPSPVVVVLTPEEETAAKSFRNLERVAVVGAVGARGLRRRLGALARRREAALPLVEGRARS